ncbi:MAG: hypothetical protein DDT23_01276 [candidate division WS2 bacterium]|nr:hypothetical protein [Candidatus Lithacetigena glycinireducens]
MLSKQLRVIRVTLIMLMGFILLYVSSNLLFIFFTDEPRYEVFTGLKKTKFIVDEPIVIDPYLIYRGLLPTLVCSDTRLLLCSIYDEEGKTPDPHDLGIICPKTSRPIYDVHIVERLLIDSYHLLIPHIPYRDRNPSFSTTPRCVNKPGKYKIVAWIEFDENAWFYFDDPDPLRWGKYIRSEPIWIEVVPPP